MDPFDRLYETWAEHAISKRLDPPSREMWDKIVLRLVLSKDPQRVRLYRKLEAGGPDSLGGDAYDLWRKIPPGTANLSVGIRTSPALREYAQQHAGSMRALMDAQGLGEAYRALLDAQHPTETTEDATGTREGKPVDRAKARRAQMNMMIIGCVGMGAILFMVLTVLLIIALKSLSH
ncbi:MAG: hypothetical protein M3014_02205 [Chloroflexota bacterium]|nr:hypothetical protein [Chloroflexota bacterium]